MFMLVDATMAELDRCDVLRVPLGEDELTFLHVDKRWGDRRSDLLHRGPRAVRCESDS